MKNFSIIIPTKDRSKQLSNLLQDLLDCDLTHVKEVIIVDESRNNTSSKIVSNFAEKSPVEVCYLKVSVNSLARAKSFAVKKAHGSMIVIFDDDIRVLDRDLFNKLLRAFSENYQLKLLGILPKRKENLTRFLYELARCFFMFNHPIKQFNVMFNGRNGGYLHLPHKKMCAAEWVAGCSFCFKREIFYGIEFEKQFLKYSFGEDFLFSHRIFQKYGGEAVKYLIDTNVIHLEELAGRIPTEERICMEHCYRAYISYKLGIIPESAVAKFLWNVLVLWGAVGDGLFSILTQLVKNKKLTYAYFKTIFLHLRYCALSLLYERKLEKDPNLILKKFQI